MVHAQFVGRCCAALALVAAGPALAGLSSPSLSGGGASVNSDTVFGGSASWSAGGFNTRDGGNSTVDGDKVSFGLKMFSENSSLFINSMGNNNALERGKPFQTIGENINGNIINGSRGNILAAWDEAVGTQTNKLTFVFKSSDGQDIMPFGVVIDGEDYSFWTWNIGIADPVNWKGGLATAPIYSAKISLSRNGGQSFFSTRSLNLPPSGEWNGRDAGETMTDVGQGMNYIKITYEVGQVPGPAVLSVLGAFGVMTSRRRR